MSPNLWDTAQAVQELDLQQWLYILEKTRFPVQRSKFPPQKPGKKRAEQAKQAEQTQQ